MSLPGSVHLELLFLLDLAGLIRMLSSTSLEAVLAVVAIFMRFDVVYTGSFSSLLQSSSAKIYMDVSLVAFSMACYT